MSMPDETEKNLEEERPATYQQGTALVNLLSNTVGDAVGDATLSLIPTTISQRRPSSLFMLGSLS